MCSFCDFQSCDRLVKNLRCEDTDFFLFIEIGLIFDNFGMKMKVSANTGLYSYVVRSVAGGKSCAVGECMI